jgi:hypothetical protein
LKLLVLNSTLLHLPPLKFHCVGGYWDRYWLSDAVTTRLDLIPSRLYILSRLGQISSPLGYRSYPVPARSHSPLGYRSYPVPARSHPPSTRSYPVPAISHPHLARSYPVPARSHPHLARSSPVPARSHPQSAKGFFPVPARYHPL